MGILKIISRLPFPVLYFTSDILYGLLWYVIRYRRNVVLQNLRGSFPEKSEKEIRRIAKKFYRHLSDVVVETLKTLTLPEASLARRVHIQNREVVEQYFRQGQSVVVVTAHQGNWEWLLVSCSLQLPFQVDAVYMKLDNAFFDQLMKKIRSRFGTYLVEKQVSFREIVRRKPLVRIIAMVADQSFFKMNYVYWTTFLHQETGFYSGSERIAHKTDMPVIFVSMHRQRRGFYQIRFQELDKPPFHPQPHYITEQYVRAVEDAIHQYPEQWLWSHKRWKRKRKTSKASVKE